MTAPRPARPRRPLPSPAGRPALSPCRRDPGRCAGRRRAWCRSSSGRPRSRGAPCSTRTDPDHAVAAARITRTLIALAAGGALGLAGACLQGLDPQPAGRPRHPRHQRRRAFAMIVAHRVPRRLRPRRLRLVRVRRSGGHRVAGPAIASRGRGGATPLTLVDHRRRRHRGAASWVVRGAAHRPADHRGVPVLAGRHRRRPAPRRAAHRPAVPARSARCLAFASARAPRLARARRRPVARPRRPPGARPALVWARRRPAAGGATGPRRPDRVRRPGRPAPGAHARRPVYAGCCRSRSGTALR